MGRRSATYSEKEAAMPPAKKSQNKRKLETSQKNSYDFGEASDFCDFGYALTGQELETTVRNTLVPLSPAAGKRKAE